MITMTARSAAACCGGILHGDGPGADQALRRIVISSLDAGPGDMFVAFRGEHTDGHAFIASAFDRGAACCLAEYVPEGETRPVITVQDEMEALEKLGTALRQKRDIPVIGVTGSVGKTTTKEMLAAVLSRRFNTLKTEGNLNNRIGVPMMLSRLTEEHGAAVIEMGISEFGEMRHLARMVQPTMAVYTVIGHAHLEFLHDLDGVLRAKAEMLEEMPETAPVLVNGDDEKLRALQCRQRKITFGFGENCDVRAENLHGSSFHVVCGLRRIPVAVPSYGRHIVYAALAAAAAGMLFGLSDEEIAAGIADFRNVGRRGEVIRTDSLTLIDDSYNANPDSVRCGIDSLMETDAGRRLCVLGDMLELGEDSRAMHRDIGRYALQKGVDLVLTAGELSRETALGAGERGHYFESREALADALSLFVKRGDCVLVKASKGSHFETVSKALQELPPLPPLAPRTAPSILLDLDDTILDFKKAEARALSRSLTSLSVPHDEKLLLRYNELNIRYWERLESGELTRPQVLLGRFVQLLKEIGSDADPAALRDLYEDNLSHGHFFVEGAEELLQALAGRFRLFLISNGTAVVQEGRLRSAGIAPFFEDIFISEHVGANKPEKAFFDRCFERIPCFDPERSLVLGDSLTSDIRGGIACGLKTCWFNLRSRPPRPDIRPDFTVVSLSEVPSLLAHLFPEA